MPVSVWETETRGLVYELEHEAGSQFYRSARRLLRAITGKDRHQTFKGYFKIDDSEEAETRPSIIEVLDQHRRKVLVPRVKGELRQTEPVLDPSEFRPGRVSKELETLKLDFRELETQFERAESSLGLSDGPNEELVRELVATFDDLYEEIAASSPKLGVDLVNRSHEVRKLLFKSFRGLMFSRGYDPEDVLQEIYRGLITRNKGKCPWDGRKSTFGYYVTMVCRGVLINYHRKMSRRLDRDFAELDESMGGWAVQESSESSDALAHDSLEKWLEAPEHGGNTPDGRLAVEIMPLVSQGYQRKEIAKLVDRRETEISRALAHLRKWSAAWGIEMGIEVRRKVH